MLLKLQKQEAAMVGACFTAAGNGLCAAKRIGEVLLFIPKTGFILNNF